VVVSSALSLYSRSPSSVSITLYIVMFVVYALAQGHFVTTPYGLSVLLNNSIALAVGATSLTFVVLTGGFDLSLAGTVALTNTILSVAGFKGVGGALEALVVVCLVGAIVGTVNGLLVAYYKLQSIAVTLGTMIMTSGIALFMLNAPGGTVPDSIAYGLTGLLGPVPVAIIILVPFTAAATVLLNYTRFGIGVFAIGQDRAAARASGVNVEWTEFRAYLTAGIVAGLSGYLVSAETGTGDPRFDASFLLLAFAAVAIGGTSFRGGRGTVIGSVVGAGLLELIQKTLFAVGVSSFFTGMFEGALMILAVLVGSLGSMMAARRSAAS